MKLFLLTLNAIIFLSTGCARSPERQYFTLTPDAASQKNSKVSFPTASIAMGPITIPDAVDRNKIVTRHQGSSRLEISDINRWSQPLNAEITTLLADDLRLKLSNTLVTTSGQNAGATQPDRRLDVDITRFEGTLGIGIWLEADWSVRDSKQSGQLHGHALIHKATQSNDYEGLVKAYEEGLHDLAEHIRKTLKDSH